MKNLKLIIFFFTITLSLSCNAQNRVEKIGHAFSGYYGASVMLKIFSEGTCKNYLKINANEFNLSMLKVNINRTLLPILSKSDYMDLQEMYSAIEQGAPNAAMDFSRTPISKCAELSDELTKIHQNKKAIWINSVK
jgi:hypothetical protein